ncbi:hypothetical protein E9840_01675 [Tissierella creatinini]|nr:hypothetical protein E9840_01675 [Tissierella creatinini]TJX66480.1 hypothetical protein E8P77_07470 [Soehngenia saccharolytica]
MNWFKKFMNGRYGFDQLSKGMLWFSIILMVIGMFTGYRLINYVAYLILLFTYIRAFSKNVYKRREENQRFLRILNPIKSKWLSFINRIKQSKTHKFYKCPSCKKQLRVPRGKGKINVTCPECKTKFEARS